MAELLETLVLLFDVLPKHVVSLYTTASPLDEYMRACPADLKEFGPHQHVECVTSVPLWR